MPSIFFVAEKEGVSRDAVLEMTSIEFYELLDYHLSKIELEYKELLKMYDE